MYQIEDVQGGWIFIRKVSRKRMNASVTKVTKTVRGSLVRKTNKEDIGKTNIE